jgi:hypothetical protein
MRERSGVTGEAETREGSGTGVDGPAGRGRLELSVPQIAGSALAAVVAAKLASSFGVYGTILGAGLVSAIATCGGTIFQHFFSRTGEQLKVKRTAEQPRVAVGSGPTLPLPGEFGEGTVYRARVRSWKRPLIAAALVFGVTMGGITAYELVSGHNLSGGTSTTVGDALSGHGKSSSDSDDSDAPGDSGGSGGSGDSTTSPSPDTDGTGSDDTPAATPSGSASGDDGTPSDGTSGQDGGTESGTPAPTATDGQGPTTDPGGSATAPAPSASGRSQSGDQDQDGPAAP